jgi:hypothetical protein
METDGYEEYARWARMIAAESVPMLMIFLIYGYANGITLSQTRVICPIRHLSKYITSENPDFISAVIETFLFLVDFPVMAVACALGYDTDIVVFPSTL